jgi:hypothetical protein
MKIPRRPWTENEQRAREMRAAGHFDGEIDKVLGRRSPARRSVGLTVRATDQGMTSERSPFQMASRSNAKRLPLRAPTAR